MDHFHRQQKTLREKRKALGPEKLRVTLTDYLKSPPSHDPVPSMDRRAPVVMYLESFCQSLDVGEEDLSFLDMLNQETMNEPELAMLNLDSGQNETMDHHAWDTDASDWLDDLIAELDEPSPLETMESHVNFENLVEDMTPDDWENVWNDVVDNFDFDLF